MDEPSLLGRIFEPRVVAVPPAAAARDLCVAASGEIRHYGRRVVDGTVRRVYIASTDGGANWTEHFAAEGDVGAMVRSPYSGDWLYWRTAEDGRMQCVRSKTGPGDVAPDVREHPWMRLELRQMLPMASRKRWVAAFSDVACLHGGCYHATVALSDDDGRTWRRIDLKPVAGVERMSEGDRRPRWYNDGCEPTVAELADGTLLLAVRTSGPHVAFCRSADGGETWSDGTPDAVFWQANTMPYLFRMKDGRLLFFWNNTQTLPTRDAAECPELDEAALRGRWESVFTNRDALHAAISEDDGKTWRGFREIILNPARNAADFRQLGNFPDQEHDKSVHQTQAIELPGGKVLLSLGQNAASRRIAVFDPQWLCETSRTEDFRHGLENLSTHLYVKSLSGGWRGFAGHCAWNRAPGAMLVRDPDTGPETAREVLQLCRVRDPRLVCDRQGVVWNFPAATSGRFETECRVDGEGFRLALTDRWINPCDETNPQRSPVAWNVTKGLLGAGWRRLSCSWDGGSGVAALDCDGTRIGEMKCPPLPRFGLSYVHLQTLAETTDGRGAYFRSFEMHGGVDLRPVRPDGDATAAIQSAVDKAFLAGGGRVVLGKGEWNVKSIRLRSRVTLRLETGAVVKGSRRVDDYFILDDDDIEPVPREWISRGKWDVGQSCFKNDFTRCPGSRWNNGLIRILGAEDAAIIGESGSLIDGMNPYDPDGEEYFRGPHGVSAIRCRNLTLKGYTIANAGNWAHRIADTRNVVVDGVTCIAGHDGVHVNGCDNVRIERCTMNTGDDCVAGFDNTDVVVRDCRLNTSCSGFRFAGTGVLIERCTLNGPGEYGARGTLSDEDKAAGASSKRAKRNNTLSFFTYYSDGTHPVRMNAGGTVIRDCVIRGADRYFHYNYGNEKWQRGKPMTDVSFERVKASGLKLAICAWGDRETPVRLSFRDCEFEFADSASELIVGSWIGCVAVDGLKVDGARGPLLRLWNADALCPRIDARNLEGVEGSVVPSDGPWNAAAI